MISRTYTLPEIIAECLTFNIVTAPVGIIISTVKTKNLSVTEVNWLFQCHTLRYLQNVITIRPKWLLVLVYSSMNGFLQAGVSCGLSVHMQAMDTGTRFSVGILPANYNKILSANSAFALGKKPTIGLLQDKCHMEPNHKSDSNEASRHWW